MLGKQSAYKAVATAQVWMVAVVIVLGQVSVA